MNGLLEVGNSYIFIHSENLIIVKIEKFRISLASSGSYYSKGWYISSKSLSNEVRTFNEQWISLNYHINQIEEFLYDYTNKNIEFFVKKYKLEDFNRGKVDALIKKFFEDEVVFARKWKLQQLKSI